MPLRAFIFAALVPFLASRAFSADRTPIFILPGLPPATTFVLPTDGQRAAALADVRQRLQIIEQHLADLPTGGLIRTETKLDLLAAGLDGGSGPRADELRGVIERLGSGADYLDNSAFLLLRQSLVRYARTLTPLQDPTIAQLYFDRRGALERDWAALQTGGDEGALDRVRRNYAWCVAHRQADAECRFIRQQLDHGNLILTLDQQHMAALLPPLPRRVVPIAFNAEGSVVNGSGILDMTARLVFLPNADLGDLQLVLNGSLNASLSANRGRMLASLQSGAQLASSVRMTLEGTKVELRHNPAASASSWTTANSVTPPLNLPGIRRLTAPMLRNIVNRKLAQSQSQMDAEIARQLGQTLAVEAKKQADEMNRTFDLAFFAQLRKHGMSPDFRASTQSSALTLVCAFCDDDDVAGRPPGHGAAKSDILAQESLLAGLDRLLARKHFDADRFCEAVFETIGLLPNEEFRNAATTINPVAVLAAEAPLRATFRNGRLRILVNIERIERDGTWHENGPWQMQGEYIVGAQRPGVVLRRFEPVQIVTTSSFRPLLPEDAERFMPDQLEFSQYTAIGQLLKNASLVISDASFDQGWAHITFTPAGQPVDTEPTPNLAAMP